MALEKEDRRVLADVTRIQTGLSAGGRRNKGLKNFKIFLDSFSKLWYTKVRLEAVPLCGTAERWIGGLANQGV
jgi:hypothetical protein